MYQYHARKKKKPGVWQTILNYGKKFCLQTSIHGFYHIAAPRRHWAERVLWLAVTAVALWGAVDVSKGQYQRYDDNPTVVTLEKDFRSWRFSLPGVTTCSQNRVDQNKLTRAIKTRWNVDPEDQRYEYYEQFVNTLANSDLFHLEGYEDFKDDQTLDVDLFELAVEVMPDQQVKASSSEPIAIKWTPVMTEYGACYVTNSIAVHDAAILKPHSNVTKNMPFTCQYSSMALCYFIFEVSTHVHFFVHSPYDISHTTNIPSTIYPSLNRFTELSVAETRAGQGVRHLSPRRRACLYTDENTEEDKTVYSTQMCRSRCRSRLAVKLCGCRPFYYFYEAGKPCNPEGMWCLSTYARELANFAGMKCTCSQLCVDSLFRESFIEDQVWDKGPFQGRGAIRLTVQAPRLRYTRVIVYHFEDLVVSFGGAAGLFLGASFISFVEIVHFGLERFINIFTTKTKPQLRLEV